MFDQSYGLRFDIYERIILSENLPGIEELEEVELIPHIQVISQEEQATLRGHLLLAGLYKGDTDSGESAPLEHWIPVEITVPMNRVSSLDDIAVEIENFDVDLLSTRSLNITGVLSLKGIQAAGQEAADRPWNDEGFTVVHAPEPTSEDAADREKAAHQEDNVVAENPSPFHFPQPQEGFVQGQQVTGFESDTRASHQYEGIQGDSYQQKNEFGYQTQPSHFYTEDSATEHNIHREEPPQEFVPAQSDEPEFSDSNHPMTQSKTEQEPVSNPNVWNFERNNEPVSHHQSSSDDFSEVNEREENQQESVTEASSHQELNEPSDEKIDAAAPDQDGAFLADDASKALAQEVQEVPPEKPELKVAFTSKDSTFNSSPSVGFSSLLPSGRTAQEQEITAIEEEEVLEDHQEEALASEEVQWKSLFLGGRQEDTPFRKVRLCIVQREETLEDIAERYQLSPRELLLYNRLSEQNVEEGQVLYIP